MRIGDPSPSRSLRKILGRRDVLALAFGAMIGWGWVVLAREMIERAGTIGAPLAFLAGAAMVFLVGLLYAELTSALPRAGGELGFTYLGIGPRLSYACGWTLVLAYLSVCAFEAVSLPTVVGYLFQNFQFLHLYDVAGWEVHASWVALGVAGSLIIGVINYFGIRLASFVQWTAAATLFLIGLSFFIPGNLRGDFSNLTPHFTSWGGFFRVLIMTPFFFLGFDVIPQVAEEIDVPFRSIGKLILLSILLAMGWYSLVLWTVGLTLDASLLAESELATADAMTRVYQSPWGGRLLIFGGLLGILTSWNAFFIGASRLLFAMSRAGMLPPVFSRLHPRYDSPVAVIALLTLTTILAPFFGRQALIWLVDAGSLAAVLAYLLVSLAFVRIRQKHPGLERPYRTPAARLVGGLALLSTIFFVLLYLPGSPSALLWPYEWGIVLAWGFLGFCFYPSGQKRVARMTEEEQTRAVLGELL